MRIFEANHNIGDDPNKVNWRSNCIRPNENWIMHLFNQTEVYKKFSEVDFQRLYKEFIFNTLLRSQ